MVFPPDDDAGEASVLQREAEHTLKKLLDKQLSTTTDRLEQVEFQQATESIHSIGHGSCGLSSLSQFVKNELVQKQNFEKTRLLQNVLHGMGYSRAKVEERCHKISCSNIPRTASSHKFLKRRRYGADPLFLSHSEAEELQIDSLECEHRQKEEIHNGFDRTSFGRHSKELKATLLRGKDRLQAIAHLSEEGSACRKPLFGEAQEIDGQFCVTPQDRARQSVEKESARLTSEVFARHAPAVLELHTYLNHRSKFESVSSADVKSLGVIGESYLQPASSLRAQEHVDVVKEIPVQDIVTNRLSVEEIRKLPCGRFTNYSPGNPSHVLYIKNLSKDVTEADLVALFVRYQSQQQPLLFRLMKRGRMKGQAFVTFSDVTTSSAALQLINGYELKGKAMVIEFGYGNPSTLCASNE